MSQGTAANGAAADAVAGAAADKAAVPWASQQGTAVQRVTARARHVVEELPTWEPLPPGELLVRRPSRS